ncbi:MAG: peptidyl-prolyl cis-trans isomerase [Planctomycetota bacterium]
MPLCCRSLLGYAALLAIAVMAGRPTPAVAQSVPEPLSECEVIARINSEVILACEIEWQVQLMLEQRFGAEAIEAAGDSPMLESMRDEIMKQLIVGRIEMALLYADFRSNAPQADLAAIKKQLEVPFATTEVPRLMEQVGTDDLKEFESRLIELGTSISERREDFYRTMIARSWLTQSTKIDNEVTHEQMLEYYHENTADYDQPERVRWEELMARFDKHGTKAEAWAAVAKLGNQAHAAVQAAAPDQPAFESAAAQSDGYTADEGGGHDWTARGSLASTEINNALFSLPPGQMSPILEGPLGFHIVRVLERKAAGPTPFRDVQAQIRTDLKDERFSVAINKKLTELKKSARLWTIFTGELSYEQLAQLQGGQRR